ncbi:MAG: hypothetical protein KAG56_02745 [Sulfurovaceae bacterium]|nr:hypothetical protein [Sulfurovaceae bacterium]
MKKITKLITLALVLGTSTLFASSSDYALTTKYKLLNDMKLAQKQQALIVKMNQSLDSKVVDIKTLKRSKEQFSQVLSGLTKGNRDYKLKGTGIPMIKSKLSEVQTLWKKELKVLASVTSDNADKERAIAGLNTLMIKMSEAVAMYNKSYKRYKQNSMLSSIVNRHLGENTKPALALNNIR